MQHLKCTQLWVYTFPVQNDGCIVIKHHCNTVAINKSNAEYNAEVLPFHLPSNLKIVNTWLGSSVLAQYI